MALHTSFLTHARGRYLWVALLVALGSGIAYVVNDPVEPANGGTPLGYTLGTVGALLILWLAYLGKRKRNFVRGWGTVRGWVSAHVYLGTALLIVATLHTGFQFGMNIHTLAYVLMVLAIFSGIFGVFAYRAYPSARNDLKKQNSLDDLFHQIEELEAQLTRMAVNSPEDISSIIKSSIDRTEVGGGFFDQLLARDKSVVELEGAVRKNINQELALDYLLSRGKDLKGEELTALNDLIRVFNSRKGLLDAVRNDIKMLAVLQVWLYIHVPTTFALISALLAHIFSVFVYW